jgi:hypothetical protein
LDFVVTSVRTVCEDGDVAEAPHTLRRGGATLHVKFIFRFPIAANSCKYSSRVFKRYGSL